MYKKTILIFLFSISLVLIPVKNSDASAYDSFWEFIYKNFDVLPEYHIEADIFMFFLHKNGYFKQRYYLENNTNLNFVFLSFRDLIYSVYYFEFQTGMGQTPGNVVFDPMDINFGIVPVVEVRIPSLNFQVGLNHHCFHEIDRKDYPTIYWNKLFLGVGSKNMVLQNFWFNLTQKEGWTYKNRISWYFTWGYFLRKFFGIVNESTINGQNYNVHDFTLDARYAFYTRRSWIFVARSKTLLGWWKDIPEETKKRGAYFRQDLSFEANFKRGRRGAMIFLTYTLDKYPLYHGVPRFSKDQLLQLGFRFFI